LAFDPARSFHAVVGVSPTGARVAVKGAPEVVLPRCITWRSPDGPRSLDSARRDQLDQVVERLTGRGLRVLAVAERSSSDRSSVTDTRVANLELLGFLGLADPVRPSAAAALADLRQAGIEVAMITGDHPSTARAIAEELGMVNGHRILSGRELDELPDSELDALLPQVSVFARVTPTHKVRIVRAYQRIGRVVAMTGDGANDAAAIRLAHAGIALGDRGSPAAREAADLVVVDDRLETILGAIIEGRALWTSVRDALAILIGGNLGEVGFTVAATALAGKSPLGARQFLLVNLLTDMLPAMTIALRPPANRPVAALLQEGPDASLGASLIRQIGLRAATTTGGSLGAWLAARATGTAGRANTVALVALVETQLGQTALVGWRSPLVLASTIASGMVLAAIVQTPGVSHFFGCRPLDPVAWGIAAGASAIATTGTLLATRAPRNRPPECPQPLLSWRGPVADFSRAGRASGPARRLRCAMPRRICGRWL
jgi:cation-transporting ATPase I